MKREVYILWMMTIFVLSQAIISYGVDCYPPGTVFREGCPREVLVSSSCEDCDPTSGPNAWCLTRKIETKSIQWSDHTDTVEFVGGGQNGINWSCDFPSVARLKKCWANYLTPNITGTSWSQKVVTRKVTAVLVCSSHPFGPFASYEFCDDFFSQTKSSSGTCSGGGGGGGGLACSIPTGEPPGYSCDPPDTPCNPLTGHWST